MEYGSDLQMIVKVGYLISHRFTRDFIAGCLCLKKVTVYDSAWESALSLSFYCVTVPVSGVSSGARVCSGNKASWCASNLELTDSHGCNLSTRDPPNDTP